MKKFILTFLLFTSIVVNATEYNEKNTIPCFKGDLKFLCDKNGQLITGLVRTRLPVVGTLVEGNYKDGKLEGAEKVYYSNGNLQIEGNFKNGNAEGVQKTYDEDGNLIKESYFNNGKREGIAKGYDSSGAQRARSCP